MLTVIIWKTRGVSVSSGILWSTKQNRIYHPDVFGVRKEWDKISCNMYGSSLIALVSTTVCKQRCRARALERHIKGSGVTVMRNWLDISEDQLLSFYDSCEQMLHTSCPALRIAYSWGIFQIQTWNRWRAVFFKVSSTCCAPTEKKS